MSEPDLTAHGFRLDDGAVRREPLREDELEQVGVEVDLLFRLNVDSNVERIVS